MDVLGDPQNRTFGDSQFNWQYGTSNNGKVTTYKFNAEEEKQTTKNNNNFAFKTAESFLNKLAINKSSVDLSKYKVGQAVYHKKFGEGIIMKIEKEGDDLKVEINFQKFGIKRLMAKYAGLEIL